MILEKAIYNKDAKAAKLYSVCMYMYIFISHVGVNVKIYVDL